jgi:hypothetical protein
MGVDLATAPLSPTGSRRAKSRAEISEHSLSEASAWSLSRRGDHQSDRLLPYSGGKRADFTLADPGLAYPGLGPIRAFAHPGQPMGLPRLWS